MANSSVVEIKGDKVRKKENWARYVLAPKDHEAPGTGMSFCLFSLHQANLQAASSLATVLISEKLATIGMINPLSTDFSASRRLKFGLRTQRAISQQLQALPPR